MFCSQILMTCFRTFCWCGFCSSSILRSLNIKRLRSFLLPFSIYCSLDCFLFSLFFFFCLSIDVFLQSWYFTITSNNSFSFCSYTFFNYLKEWIKTCWFFSSFLLFDSVHCVLDFFTFYTSIIFIV